MTKKKFNISGKIIGITLIVFIIGCILLGVEAYYLYTTMYRDRLENGRLNAETYAHRVEDGLDHGLYIAETLEQVVISGNGEFDNFEEIAENLMTDFVRSIRLAPDGVVTNSYPEKDNELGKIDILHDEERRPYAEYARDHDVTIMQGPFKLKQGGEGLVIENPVFIEKDGKRQFWGFVNVAIVVPDIFADSLDALEGFGYDYCLEKEVSPWEAVYQKVYGSGNELEDPMMYQFSIGENRWRLLIEPKSGWHRSRTVLLMVGDGVVILVLLTGLILTLLILEEKRSNLKKMALTDALTGIFNRNGFDKTVDGLLAKYPDQNCVGVELDIDDFKFLNDIYGHDLGDQAIRRLADSMRECFKGNVVLGRTGGDEFCALLLNETCESVGERLDAFVKTPQEISYKDKKITFCISLGYAEYPKHARDRKGLIKCADAALYEVKLHGKNGCMAYEPGFGDVRTQLGFALKDITEHLPGAFLIYRADPGDDELLMANKEMLRLTGCKNLDEFFTFTGRRFRNLIEEDEQESVEQDIWRQINAGDGHLNDYVSFHLMRKGDKSIPVMDHGRIVESLQYGKVFYVLIMDQESMIRHYGQDRVIIQE